ncbi:MAG: hypothetical protein WA803_22635 [Steroidobacteraceae bacterium]
MNGYVVRDTLTLVIIILALFAIGAFAGYASRGISGTQSNLSPSDWLLSAPSDEERFRRLQQQLRGFDLTMWEVGERFRRMHEALARANYELALYHWSKITATINNGLVRRPGKVSNARAFLLASNSDDIHAKIDARTPQSAWEGFNRAKVACQACHQAENVAFVNQQPLFDLAPPPDGQ